MWSSEAHAAAAFLASALDSRDLCVSYDPSFVWEGTVAGTAVHDTAVSLSDYLGVPPTTS